jgi:Icc-related predicted phosphoesterase
MMIAAMSDLHGFQPTVPAADVVILAGDICPDSFGRVTAAQDPRRQAAWFEHTIRPWVREFGVPTLITWGNHDFIQHQDLCALTRGNLQIAVDELVEVDGLRVWLTPWSNRFMNWHWMKTPAELAKIYDRIPAGIDILVSHQPPYGCGDGYVNMETSQYEHIGSRELLNAIRRVRPQLVICGHLHGGYGVYDIDGIPIHNVSVVNEAYQLVHPVTLLTVAPRKGAAHAVVHPPALLGHRERN